MVVSIWITDNCNMNCDYCYVGEKGKRNMPLSFIEKIILFINRQQPLSGTELLYIKFFGGEPLMNFGFIKQLMSAIQMQKYNFPVRYSITTNGTLFNSEIISYMVTNSIDCSISMDGLPEIHDKHRKMKNGKGSWKIIRENMKSLRKQGLDVTARMTCTSYTADCLLDSVKFLVKEGFRNIQAVPDYFDAGWDDECFKGLSKQYNLVKEYGKKHPELNITIGISEKNARKGNTGCGGGISTFSINVDGDIFPCTYAVAFPKFKIGDIFHIEDYQPSDFTVKREDRKDCKGCRYFQICISGRCIFLNYKITGDFYRPGDFFCSYQKLGYQYLGL